jgi:hypothetical protein
VHWKKHLQDQVKNNLPMYNLSLKLKQWLLTTTVVEKRMFWKISVSYQISFNSQKARICIVDKSLPKVNKGVRVNISVISWRSVLLVGKPECPKKTTDPQKKLEKKYAPALDSYGQSCCDFLKMKCVCKKTIRNYKQVKSSLTLCMMFYHTHLVYR